MEVAWNSGAPMGSTEKMRTSARSYVMKRGAPYSVGSGVTPFSLHDTRQLPAMPMAGDVVIKVVEFTGMRG
eukprot:scaffold47692_cov30-Tisochrysis_lutea.AAC.3